MAAAGRARPRRAVRRLLTALVAVLAVVVGAAVASEVTGVGEEQVGPLVDPVVETADGWWDFLTDQRDDPDGPGDPGDEPAEVAPPEGLDLPPVADPVPVAAELLPGDLSPAAVRRALRPVLDDPLLGPRVGVEVAALTAGPAAYSQGPRRGLVPASTTKLLTAVGALTALERDATFETRTLLQGRTLVLVGGGDPLLRREPDPGAYPARADVETLAALTADALEERGRTTVRLRYDATLFDGPAFNPRWPDSYRGDVVAPITSLWVDGGRPEVGFGRVADPARAAADAFARALAAEGLTVQGDPTAGRARRAADPVAEVSSAPVAQLVDHALQVSDNEVTEVLLRHVGLATSGEGSSAAGTAGVEQALTDLGVPLPTALYDGSGLSRENLISPATLTGLLREVAVSDPTDPLRVLLPGLPVAAFSGSLTTRFDDAPAVALGQVRAKTGTLRSVRSLSGVAVSRDGTPMVFALMVDRVPDLADEAAEDVLDRAAAALAACRCGRDVGSTP